MTIINIEASLIGYYKRKNSQEGVDMTISDFFQGIQSGQHWQKHTEWVREADPSEPRKPDPDKPGKLLPNEYDRRKEQSPCVTIAGTFNGEKKADNLRLPSGLLAADLDHLNERTEAVRFQLSQDPYVLSVFKSIGGKGLCVIFRIDAGRWADSFAGVADYLITTYGLVGKQFDPSSSNINRLRFVSYDPDIHVNYKCKLFNKYPKKEKKEPKKTGFVHTDTDINYIIDQINGRALDITGGYNEWYKLGWSLISKYGEEARDLFHQISQYSDSYDADDCDKKFKYLIDTRPERITIATFYYHCKQAAIDIMTPETREVVSKAAASKRNKVTAASCLDTVLRMTDIPEEYAKPIIEQVYASSEAFDTNETLFDQLELFLKMNYNLRFNEITHFIEDNGIELKDRDMNDVYIAAAKAFDMKVTPQNVSTLLHSHFVPGYHPLKDFFNKHKDRKPTGVIDALCDTIKHQMPGNYVQFFMRKFLVGLVGSIYGKQCPLMPVICGPQNTGKTQFWRRFLPAEISDYYGECKFRKPGDDEMLMTKKIVLMNDDFSTDFLANHARFKSLTDSDTFSVRKPYGKAHEDLKRLAMICGTSNETALLSDPTGNRRIIPILIESIDYTAYNAIDKIDLLMEAYWLYQDGERGNLTPEQVLFLKKHTTKFIDYSLERDIVEKYFTVPEKKGDGELWSQGEILIYLQQMTGVKNLKPKTISLEMKALGFPYVDGEYYKPEGKSKRGFWLWRVGNQL